MQIDVRGIPIHYEDHGDGQPLLAIHGVTTDRRHLVAELEPILAPRAGGPSTGRSSRSGSTAWRRSRAETRPASRNASSEPLG